VVYIEIMGLHYPTQTHHPETEKHGLNENEDENESVSIRDGQTTPSVDRLLCSPSSYPSLAALSIASSTHDAMSD